MSINEREIKTIKTPIKQYAVVLKEWLTGREKRTIQSIYTKDVKFREGGKYEVSADKINEAQNAMIETVVVSVDGKTENLLDVVLDMRSQDYDFVMKEIDVITSGKKDEKNLKE